MIDEIGKLSLSYTTPVSIASIKKIIETIKEVQSQQWMKMGFGKLEYIFQKKRVTLEKC